MLARSIRRSLSDRDSVIKCAVRSRSVAAAAQEMEDKVRGLEDIPSPPLVPVLKHLPLILNKKNAYDMTTFAAGLREKFGDIVRLQIPGMGNGNMIMLFKAKAGLNNLHKNEMIILVFKKALGAK